MRFSVLAKEMTQRQLSAQARIDKLQEFSVSVRKGTAQERPSQGCGHGDSCGGTRWSPSSFLS